MRWEVVYVCWIRYTTLALLNITKINFLYVLQEGCIERNAEHCISEIGI